MVAGIAGAIGTIGGGIFADWLGKRDKRWQLWIPMWGKFIGGPIFIVGLMSHDPYIALTCYGIGLTLAAAYLGPSLAVTHSLVPPGMRAMSSAVLFLILNMIGLGLGPLLVGMASDFFNDAAACNMADQAVQAARSCARTENLYAALKEAGMVTAKTLNSVDLTAAYASGFQTGDMAQQAGLHGRLAFSFREAFPGIADIGVGRDALRWAMIACVVVTYPLSILWHLGAQALPKPTKPEAEAA
jgi:hypothetical protein